MNSMFLVLFLLINALLFEQAESVQVASNKMHLRRKVVRVNFYREVINGDLLKKFVEAL
ncbi:hypothetical protein OQJ02_14600 [Legionella sp. PATHC032]|uniref:hypothetical protein n=1 Tax=Legionella sp. PATHC032 TaxID=2992039 RepID=UPI001B0291F9|nr:hypothetical protein [Legionella sp. PATHC032]MCW8422855.1 hypothetical protein [Legionella sp. PATHC032]HAZ7572834.1 hypothetical protein [Legionella pneumophila]HBA1636098.1 hypothetical protein [Legionella pneumophila]